MDTSTNRKEMIRGIYGLAGEAEEAGLDLRSAINSGQSLAAKARRRAACLAACEVLGVVMGARFVVAEEVES